MAVQPIHFAIDLDDDGCGIDTVVDCHRDDATHVCFALDDLPELAFDLAIIVDITAPPWLVDLVADRLRGTTPDPDVDPVHP